jgi:hypothetical protein
MRSSCESCGESISVPLRYRARFWVTTTLQVGFSAVNHLMGGSYEPDPVEVERRKTRYITCPKCKHATFARITP